MNGQEVLKEPLPNLRALWEDTSFQLERLQADEICVKQEKEGLAKRTQPYFKLTFDPCEMPGISQLSKTNQDWYHLQSCVLRLKINYYLHDQIILQSFFEYYINYLVY